MARKKSGRSSVTPGSPATNPSSPAVSRPVSPTPRAPVVQVPVGFSFGSQYGAVAIIKDEVAQVIANEDGERSTPMWVTYADDHHLVGAPARQAALRHVRTTISDVTVVLGLEEEEADTVRSGLTRIATPWVTGAWEIEIEEVTRRVTPVDAAALLLDRLKETAESHLGMPVNDVVIAVPASFTEKQRLALLDSAAKANLKVQRLINEPTAAALAVQSIQPTAGDSNILVLDLGANSLDMTLLSSFGGVYEVVNTRRDTQSGCRRLDDIIVTWLSNEFKRKTRLEVSDNARARNKLRLAGEQAKRTLSSTQIAPCTIESLHEGQDLQASLNRGMFESIAAPYFSSIHQTIESFAKESAPLGVQTVLLSGGGCNIPRIQSLIAGLFPNATLARVPNPEESAAIGAAIEAGIISASVRATDAPETPSLSLVAGAEVDALGASVGVEDAEGNVVHVLRKGCPVPAKRTVKIPISNVGEERTALISVTTGESTKASENKRICQLALQHIHAAAKEIEVSMTVDAAGAITVAAYDRADHQGVSVVVAA